MSVTRPLFVCIVLALALGLQAKNCPDQFTAVGHKCYYVSLTKENWHVADRKCRQLGGDLAALDSELDKIQTTAYLKSLGLPFVDDWRDSVWIGINCLGNRRNFRLSKNGASCSYPAWVPKEPDNASPQEDCVAFANYNGAFGYHDIECDKLFPFLCEAKATDDYQCLKNELFLEARLPFVRTKL